MSHITKQDCGGGHHYHLIIATSISTDLQIGCYLPSSQLYELGDLVLREWGAPFHNNKV